MCVRFVECEISNVGKEAKNVAAHVHQTMTSRPLRPQWKIFRFYRLFCCATKQCEFSSTHNEMWFFGVGDFGKEKKGFFGEKNHPCEWVFESHFGHLPTTRVIIHYCILIRCELFHLSVQNFQCWKRNFLLWEAQSSRKKFAGNCGKHFSLLYAMKHLKTDNTLD